MRKLLLKIAKFNEDRTVADTCLIGALMLAFVLVVCHIPVPTTQDIKFEIVLDTVPQQTQVDSVKTNTTDKKIEELKKKVLKQTKSMKGITVTWYGDKEHGNLTANGEVFSRYKHTTAIDRTYEYLFPMGCKLLVINNDNGKSTIVKVNDRGGFGKHKYARVNPEVVLDLSEAAFKAIGSLEKGKLRNVTIILLEK